MRKKAHIIIGLGYGDEGKGLVTDFFCARSVKPIVIRFNGGQQAGHTVFLKSGRKHIFSNFGSGTLRSIPTFWSQYCTFSPGFFLEELKLLKVTPQFYIDGTCPVTTHYDILYNRIIETYRGNKRHGSCGLGFGSTINRHKEFSVKLTASDLLKRKTCLKKLIAIRDYYKHKIQKETNFLFSVFKHDKEDQGFVKQLEQIRSLVSRKIIVFANESEIFSNKSKWETYIFEGAQGILLDINHGLPPYVTKSNTTSQNALAIIKRNFININIDVNVVYVTRAYNTRHGEGPFTAAIPPMKLVNIFHETNVFNEYQGTLRIGNLDISKLNYAIKCDHKYSKNLPKHLFVTCLDQVDYSRIPIYLEDRKHFIEYESIQRFIDCDFKSIHYSFNKCADFLL